MNIDNKTELILKLIRDTRLLAVSLYVQKSPASKAKVSEIESAFEGGKEILETLIETSILEEDSDEVRLSSTGHAIIHDLQGLHKDYLDESLTSYEKRQQLIEEINSKIFELESTWLYGNDIRRECYRLRIDLGRIEHKILVKLGIRG